MFLIFNTREFFLFSIPFHWCFVFSWFFSLFRILSLPLDHVSHLILLFNLPVVSKHTEKKLIFLCVILLIHFLFNCASILWLKDISRPSHDEVKLLRWSPDYIRRLASKLAFAAKLYTSSSVKLLRWLPDWLHTTIRFCYETFDQFWCETFTMIARLTTYDRWLLLRNFAPVLV